MNAVTALAQGQETSLPAPSGNVLFLRHVSELASWPALTKAYQSVVIFHCILDKNPRDLMCLLLPV